MNMELALTLAIGTLLAALVEIVYWRQAAEAWERQADKGLALAQEAQALAEERGEELLRAKDDMVQLCVKLATCAP
jgi:hypothetical protein